AFAPSSGRFALFSAPRHPSRLFSPGLEEWLASLAALAGWTPYLKYADFMAIIVMKNTHLQLSSFYQALRHCCAIHFVYPMLF
ncbi:hypothetical protein, partial [Geobacillus kaustophilus]|uniref:hypothetical protein n=1 Tax=Geobacillus kaustophilus TaxID=1462 RepID=UPI001E58E3C3